VSRVILDTGPLVALLNRRDRFHRWARRALDTVVPPVSTCEAVISEACFLLSRVDASGADAVLALIAGGVVELSFSLDREVDPVKSLMRKFRNVPMSLADACLVRMTEHESSGRVMTLDSDFRIYRRNGRQVVPTIMPDELIR